MEMLKIDHVISTSNNLIINVPGMKSSLHQELFSLPSLIIRTTLMLMPSLLRDKYQQGTAHLRGSLIFWSSLRRKRLWGREDLEKFGGLSIKVQENHTLSNKCQKHCTSCLIFRVITKKSVPSVLNEKSLLTDLDSFFLVNLLYAHQDRQNLFLLLDYLPGGDLRYHLSRKKFS